MSARLAACACLLVGSATCVPLPAAQDARKLTEGLSSNITSASVHAYYYYDDSGNTCTDNTTFRDPRWGAKCSAWDGYNCDGYRFSKQLKSNCPKACKLGEDPDMDPCYAAANGWTDSMHFDCAIYEGAEWCAADGGLGPGWCETGYYVAGIPESEQCTLSQGRDYSWGTCTAGFTDRRHPLSASKVCAGCGSSCPTQPPTREPIQFPFGCTDYAADADGKMWRDSSGYTCKAYQYGNFCALNAQTGRYAEAGLWLAGDYGSLEGYAWDTYIDGNQTHQDATTACCVCGGGVRSEATAK